MTKREARRKLGNLRKRVPELKLAKVSDPRRRQGRRWSLHSLLCSVIVGLVAGMKSLSQVEQLFDNMSPAARKLLGVRGRVPDTTLRNLLVRLEPDELSQRLHCQIRKAHKRKALAPEGLPFGIVALDGRSTTLKVDKPSRYVQLHKSDDGKKYALMQTVTATLASSRQKVCIHASPLPSGYGEQSHYTVVLHQLLKAYGPLKLFKMVSYDAGGCSKVNARNTRELGLHYLMRINNQPNLQKEARRRAEELGEDSFHAETVDQEPGKTEIRRIWVMAGPKSWPHWAGAHTLIVRRRIIRDREGTVVSDKHRCYVSSLPSDELSAAQWLRVVRGHWAVENNCHHTFDAVFREDDQPWIVTDPVGALVVLMLRRIAYNIVALDRFNYVADAKHLPPWRTMQMAFFVALLQATQEHVRGFRPIASIPQRN